MIGSLNSAVAFEILKLIIQLIGALLVAKLAVGWALERYKSEKIWERRMIAYIDALTAIGELERISGDRYDRAIEMRDAPGEYEIEETSQYKSSNRKLAEAIISARLLFSDSTSIILADLDNDLKNARSEVTYVEYLDHVHFALKKAKDALIEDGRTSLKLG